MSRWRYVGGAIAAIIGLFFVSSQIVTLVGFIREMHYPANIELRTYFPLLVVVCSVILTIGLAFLFLAWRLLRRRADCENVASERISSSRGNTELKAAQQRRAP